MEPGQLLTEWAGLSPPMVPHKQTAHFYALPQMINQLWNKKMALIFSVNSFLWHVKSVKSSARRALVGSCPLVGPRLSLGGPEVLRMWWGLSFKGPLGDAAQWVTDWLWNAESQQSCDQSFGIVGRLFGKQRKNAPDLWDKVSFLSQLYHGENFPNLDV